MNSLKDIVMPCSIHSEIKRMTKVGIKIKEIPLLVFFFLIECLKKNDREISNLDPKNWLSEFCRDNIFLYLY
jgi:hypothetical protein